MRRVQVFRNPFNGESDTYSLEGKSIGEWLLETYGEVPKVNVYIYAGDKPSVSTDITGNVARLLADDEEVYTVLEAPGVGFDPVSILINIAISMVLSAAVNSLFGAEANKTPVDTRTQESPNNVLSERTNRLRIMERVEDIYGTVRAIPSLMMPTYDKYDDHRRVEYGLYCVGRGYYNLADIREGETLLAGVSGASLKAYGPFTSPNSGHAPILTVGGPIFDPVLSVTRSSQVDELVLRAANQFQLPATDRYRFRGAGGEEPIAFSGNTMPATSGDIIYQTDAYRRPNFNAITEVGQTVTYNTGIFASNVVFQTGTLTVNAAAGLYQSSDPGLFKGVVVGSNITIPDGTFANPGNNGVKSVTAAGGNAIQVSGGGLTNETNPNVTTGTVFRLFTGSGQVSEVGDGYVKLIGNIFPSQIQDVTFAVSVLNGWTDEWSDWFTLPDGSRTEIWTNMVARLGMYKDNGGRTTTAVGYEVQVGQLDGALNPTGYVETYSGSISGSVSSERAETLEHVTGWVGPARVRIRRTTPFQYGFAGVIVDEITWTDLYAVSPVNKAHFGNKTIMQTVTVATPGAAAIRQRQLNCLASRLLPTYNGGSFSGSFAADGSLVSGVLNPTDKIVDILAAVTLDPRIGQRPISELDMAQIWSVQLALDAWHANVGRFNYTFDDDGISYEETINIIAGAAFCKAYKQNNVIRLALDRPQANSVAVFTHRNKQPKAETITRRFSNDSDYDGIELSYMDRVTEAMETIRLPLSGAYTKLKRIEVTGIAYYEQAWYRANREYARLLNERVGIETAVTVDARAVLPNSRVDIVDNTRFRSWDGEVLAQSGLELTLSRDVEFKVGETHSIILKKRDGTPMVIMAFPGSAPNRVVLLAPPPEAIVTDSSPVEGVRTAFSFGPDVARLAQSWLVNELSPAENGYIRLVGVNYTDAYYAMDSAAIPARNGVLGS